MKHLLSAKEAAPRFGVSPQTLHRLARLGRIPHYQIGSRRSFDPLELEEVFRRSTCLQTLEGVRRG
jgi:excisionase family DNA binding protein